MLSLWAHARCWTEWPGDLTLEWPFGSIWNVWRRSDHPIMQHSWMGACRAVAEPTHGMVQFRPFDTQICLSICYGGRYKVLSCLIQGWSTGWWTSSLWSIGVLLPKASPPPSCVHFVSSLHPQWHLQIPFQFGLWCVGSSWLSRSCVYPLFQEITSWFSPSPVFSFLRIG